MTTQIIATTQAAALLKRALRAQYPGVKFSVRTERGTACAWLRVSYTDGPTVRAVQHIADGYCGQRFNAITDVYDVLPDRLVTVDGRTHSVRYLVDGVLASREIGPEGRAAVAERVAAVAPGVTAQDPDGNLAAAYLTPEQATELGVPCIYASVTVRDAAHSVLAGLDLTPA